MNYLQKELYELLKKDDRIFDFLQESALDGMWYWDLENPENEWMNPTFWETMGYDPNEMPHKASAWQDIINKDDLNSTIDSFEKHCAEPNHAYDQLVRYKHKNGSTVWIRCRGMAIRDEDGKPIRMLGAHTDMTSYKDKEQLLLKYQDLLEKTNQVARIGTWEVDLINNKVSWSEVTREIHEVEGDFELSVENGIDFYKEGKSRETITRVFNDSYTKGENYDVELQIITAKGNEKWVRAIGIPEMENGQCTRVYGLFQDIDEKTKANQQIALQEELFRKTFEFAAIGMALVGLKGEWLQVNKSLCDLVGYTEEELLQLTFQDITHPDDLDKDLSLLRELINGERESYQMEKRYHHKNGGIVWVLLSVSMVKDDSGSPLHFISQITDITDGKRAQREIETLLDVTQEQNKRLLNFAHIVSHNLRSHSGNMAMILDLFKKQVPSATENEFFPLVNEASDNLKETVSHLNEVVAINTNTDKKLFEENLWEYIEKAIVTVKALAIETGAIIENKVQKQLKVKAIPAYLESITLNLITNALKYRSPERKPVIVVTSSLLNPFVKLTVKDNGLGIDLKKHSAKLFGMYKTFHGNKDARGVGLFITKNQVEAMGGKIEVESEIDKGTSFNIYLQNETN